MACSLHPFPHLSFGKMEELRHTMLRIFQNKSVPTRVFANAAGQVNAVHNHRQTTPGRLLRLGGDSSKGASK